MLVAIRLGRSKACSRDLGRERVWWECMIPRRHITAGRSFGKTCGLPSEGAFVFYTSVHLVWSYYRVLGQINGVEVANGKLHVWLLSRFPIWIAERTGNSGLRMGIRDVLCGSGELTNTPVQRRSITSDGSTLTRYPSRLTWRMISSWAEERNVYAALKSSCCFSIHGGTISCLLIILFIMYSVYANGQ